ncbi:hypothetical protein RhiirA5_433125 [Rhizophagus irregularis]|uniref:TLDc domain-containing protein n=1 Tax=Rhizophagus irregularis TaxID=588596 RepID=A0A2N0NSA4_9GLOM|nr:hypothetical protein RhiirA5_433125 [Rhizophagus irregularis]
MVLDHFDHLYYCEKCGYSKILEKYYVYYGYCILRTSGVKDSNEILGGYNPLTWDSYEDDYTYGFTTNSFIFSFKNKENIENYVLSRVKCGSSHAIYNHTKFGPSFGRGDFFVLGKHCYDRSSCSSFDYDKSIRETKDNFSVEEYEIFEILKE